MLPGAHAPNAAFTQADYDRIVQGAFASVKLLNIEGTKHSIADILRLQHPDVGMTHFMMRLPDSRGADGKFPLYTTYANKLIGLILVYYKAGIRWFQIDCEPNWLWVFPNYGPYNYRYFMRLVMPLVRASIPSDCVLISPPLSFAPALWHHDQNNPTPYILDEWLHVYEWRGPNDDEQPLIEMFDKIGADAYWQTHGQMLDPSFGACGLQLYNRWGSPTKERIERRAVVVEFANTCYLQVDHQTNEPLYTPSQVEAIRRDQYPEWQAHMKASGVVDGTYVYILPGATDDWAGDRLEESVARAMAAGLPVNQ